MRWGLIALFAALPAMVLAQEAAAPGTNMPPNFYPHPKCEKPDSKILASTKPGNDPDARQAYNLKVRNFNLKVAAFNICMKTYVDNAQNDVGTIQAMVHAAVADTNTH